VTTMPSDTWSLIKEGKYEDALGQADREAAETGSLLPYRNKVLALLNLGWHSQAVRQCEEVISLSAGDTDSDYIFLGVAHWLAGEADAAIAAWEGARQAKYTDAAGGIEAPLLLWFAGVRERRDELKKRAATAIRRIGSSPRAKNWPGPLAAVVSRGSSLSELIPQMSSQPLVQPRQVCQASFFLGVARLEAGDEAAARELMRQAASQQPTALLRPEHYLAGHESRRSDPSNGGAA
jgi:tetratricopeptide (TPR) repeat protein